jgi:hypothetical protein
MSTNGFNQQKAEAFAERILDVLNDGSIALMTSIGHRTGLFDTMAELPPSTSEQIAAATGLQERYVREWLGAMVVSRIVEYDPQTATYLIPPEHAASLTRAAAPNNMAAFTQYIGLLGSVEDGIVESFRHGGGVSYSEFNRFQEVMAEDSGQSVVPALFDYILPTSGARPDRAVGARHRRARPGMRPGSRPYDDGPGLSQQPFYRLRFL